MKKKSDQILRRSDNFVRQIPKECQNNLRKSTGIRENSKELVTIRYSIELNNMKRIRENMKTAILKFLIDLREFDRIGKSSRESKSIR